MYRYKFDLRCQFCIFDRFVKWGLNIFRRDSTLYFNFITENITATTCEWFYDLHTAISFPCQSFISAGSKVVHIMLSHFHRNHHRNGQTMDSCNQSSLLYTCYDATVQYNFLSFIHYMTIILWARLPSNAFALLVILFKISGGTFLNASSVGANTVYGPPSRRVLIMLDKNRLGRNSPNRPSFRNTSATLPMESSGLRGCE